MATLIEGLVPILAREVGEAERARAARHLLDWLGCVLLGATSEPGRALAAYGRAAPSGPCLAIAAGARDGATAALVNGGLGNIFEMDDVHRMSILHPGDTAIPAALAAAQREGSEGAALLDGLVRGYEASIRIGSAVGTEHYRYWYNTSTCGVFGAAAAAASVLGLDHRQTMDALGQAGMLAAGLWQCRIEPTFSKQLAAGRAAQSGLLAADLARIGFPGARQILEGSHGLFAATSGNSRPEEVIADAEGPWKIWETSFKPWAACRHAHPAIEAALRLRDDIDPRAVERAELVTYGDAVAFCDKPEPETPLEARFSLQHSVAVALLAGPPELEHFEPPAIADAEISGLRQKIRVVADAALTEAYPRRLGAVLSLWLASGERRRAEVATPKGDPENPMSEAELEAKARRLMAAAGLAPAAAEEIAGACHALLDGGTVEALCQALARATPTARAAE